MSFQVILLDLMKQCNLNQRQLSKETGIPPTTISGWFNAHRLPDFYSLIRLSNFFDVSSDFLLGLSKDEEMPRLHAPTPTALPLDETELLKNYRALSYAGKARVAAYADLMREQEEGTTPSARKKA